MSLAAHPTMMQRDRQREGLGLRVCRAAWLLGLTVRECRAFEAGDAFVMPDLWDRMVEVFQWPLALHAGVAHNARGVAVFG